ncbi:MAG: glycosyltransferase [Bacteroidetes bacterium]|nr:glycosyltransferase [Bacteroidota bacterium]
MNGPEVSIIIPAFNAEKWLADAVKSLLAQTFSNWELIIVNDGSTDGTPQLARSFQDRRIRVLDQANAGVSAARNAGLAMAQGNYIGFLDADDAMLAENLARKLHLLAQSGADWAFADVAVCGPDLAPTGVVIHGTDGDVLRTALLQERPAVPLSCGNIVASSSCFRAGIRLDERLSNAADQDFTIQLAARFRPVHVKEVLCLYRNLAGSMSKDVQLFQDDHLRLFRNARKSGLLNNLWFRRRCMANVYWAIGGSWWMVANRRMRALPWFLRAFACRPAVALRPLRARVDAIFGNSGARPSMSSRHSLPTEHRPLP